MNQAKHELINDKLATAVVKAKTGRSKAGDGTTASKDLQEMLKSEGVELIQLTIKDMNAGDEIEKAIADEAVAKKRVETAEQNRLKAKKDAQTKVINAKAEADANKILEKQLTNKILAQQWIKKWNGEVPKVSGDNKSMINIGELMK